MCIFLASGIIEEGGTREYAFGLVTAERTFHLTAETAMDKKYIRNSTKTDTCNYHKLLIMLSRLHTSALYGP